MKKNKPEKLYEFDCINRFNEWVKTNVKKKGGKIYVKRESLFHEKETT